MIALIVAILSSMTTASLCWEYPGYPGVDCPTARQKMSSQQPDDVRWMLPRCHSDGTFVDLQCYEKYPNVCMCVAADGSPLTLPGFGVDPVTCVCFTDQYDTFVRDPSAELPRCAKDGSYEPLQCSQVSGECWCVDREGKVLVPPSADVHSCDK